MRCQTLRLWKKLCPKEEKNSILRKLVYSSLMHLPMPIKLKGHVRPSPKRMPNSSISAKIWFNCLLYLVKRSCNRVIGYQSRSIAPLKLEPYWRLWKKESNHLGVILMILTTPVKERCLHLLYPKLHLWRKWNSLRYHKEDLQCQEVLINLRLILPKWIWEDKVEDNLWYLLPFLTSTLVCLILKILLAANKPLFTILNHKFNPCNHHQYTILVWVVACQDNSPWLSQWWVEAAAVCNLVSEMFLHNNFSRIDLRLACTFAKLHKKQNSRILTELVNKFNQQLNW